MYFEISKKSTYAVLALFELALRGLNTPLNARKLAQQHNLPVRFLEVILNELKQGGFVVSIRGKAGGYILSRPASEITLGDLFNFLENRSSEPHEADESSIPGQFAIGMILQQANAAVARILEHCTLEEMVQREMEHRSAFESNFVI